jgi:serine/threonine-protein kinase
MRNVRPVQTISYPGPSTPPEATPSTPPGATPSRCKVAMAAASGSAFRGAIAELLRHRLRTVVLIALLPLVYFAFEHALHPDPAAQGASWGLAVHGAIILVLASLAVIVWRPCEMTLSALRGIELVLFGSLATFFAWKQYAGFECGRPFGVDCYKAGHDVGPDLIRSAAAASAFPWFFLIVIYGVFIPSTWRRCALMTGAAALMPLVVTPIAAQLHHHYPPGLWQTLPDMAVLLATGMVVAVLGSYRIHALQEQAFEAQQLGQYRLQRRLGAGGMGEVFLAEHLLLRRPCAVKLIRPEQAGDPTNLRRFEREVQAMAALTHWNTVEVFDYGHAEDGTFYYVMEYLPGRNLEQLVETHGPLPPARAIHFLRQVCRALREAHGVGLLHRDIKPSNVLACERGGVWDVAKLLDFGLVQERTGRTDGDNRLTLQGTILGSPPFMSPEQAAGKGHLDARSDIYSVGGVAYFLLTGRAPFERESALEMLIAHASEPVVPPSRLRPEVPADLEAIVLRCLEKEPGKRFADADSLEKALAACADAGRWAEEDAAAWWKEHREAPATEAEINNAPTKLAVP